MTPPVASDRSAPSALTRLVERIDARADGAPTADTVPTGFPSVDRLLGDGMRTGDLTVLGGDVGSGKSAFALAVAMRATLLGHRTAFFSSEMAPDRVHERVLAIQGRARIDDMRRGTLTDAARAGLGEATVALRELPPIAHVLPSSVEALGDAVAGLGGARLVVVDAIQALAAPDRPLDEGIAAAVRALKMLAIRADVAILATSHVPGLVRDRPDPRPTLDDFGALQSVKQTADLVLGLFREEMYGGAHNVEGATELLALKNRNGATGYVDLYFYSQWMRFEDLLEPE